MPFNEIVKLVSQIDDKEIFGGVSPEIITACERRIGVIFPLQYKEYLRAFGCGRISSEEFIGLGGPIHLDVCDIIAKLRMHTHLAPFPNEFLPLLHDGFGNYDCVDCSQNAQGFECPIVEWVHDSKDKEYRLLSPDLHSWFVDLIELVKRLDAEVD